MSRDRPSWVEGAQEVEKVKHVTAAARLSSWVFLESSVAETARRLNVSRQTLYNWMSGDKVPTVENTLAIERVTGIPSALWVAESIIRAAEVRR